MSESVVDGPVDDTVEADDGQDVAEGTAEDGTEDFSAEDQAAEEALYTIMRDDEVAHWKEMAQRHEKTARDNSKAATKLREIEDANKSELQKAVERQQAAESERDAVITQGNRMRAAAALKLDSSLVDFLGDGTAEEITARAETLAGIIEESATRKAQELVAQMNQQGRQPGTPTTGVRRPVENLRAGAAPASQQISTPDQMFRDLLRPGNLHSVGPRLRGRGKQL
jgi:hypothetical protein